MNLHPARGADTGSRRPRKSTELRYGFCRYTAGTPRMHSRDVCHGPVLHPRPRAAHPAKTATYPSKGKRSRTAYWINKIRVFGWGRREYGDEPERGGPKARRFTRPRCKPRALWFRPYLFL